MAINADINTTSSSTNAIQAKSPAYGVINFYAKIGFPRITEGIAQAPLPLSYPKGWLGQSLT
ncbi:MAG: hypothetical protein GKR98_01030 [Boseongicola sp.]|nr:MAG: hypothetical protein GKR98_01030 [Boseongicola sp.]